VALRLIVLTLLIGVALGFAMGGSLRDFPTTPIRAGWVALGGVALQFLDPAGWKGAAALLTSFALLLVFAVVNIRVAGFVLISVGLSLNALVIAANAGMPIAREAIVRSDQAATIGELEAGGGGSKHHLAGDDTRLMVLGDAIGIPAPIGQAVSVGDLVLHAGIVWLVASAMQPRRRAADASTFGVRPAAV